MKKAEREQYMREYERGEHLMDLCQYEKFLAEKKRRAKRRELKKGEQALVARINALEAENSRLAALLRDGCASDVPDENPPEPAPGQRPKPRRADGLYEYDEIEKAFPEGLVESELSLCTPECRERLVRESKAYMDVKAPLFGDEEQLDEQEKALGKLLDESWNDLLEDMASGKTDKAEAPAPEPELQPKPAPVQRKAVKDDRLVRRPTGDIPATPPEQSKLYPMLPELIDKYIISAAEAERISEIAYRTKTSFKEAPGGFCAQYAFQNMHSRSKIAYNVLAENPFLEQGTDGKTLKFVSDLKYMIKGWKRREAEMKAAKSS